MKIIILFFLLILTFVVKADEPRWNTLFTSSNDKYELRLLTKDYSDPNLKWSLIEKSSGKELYRLTARIAEMTVLVSDDGNNLVAIDDYSMRDPAGGLDVVSFYSRGKPFKQYTLDQLVPTNAAYQTVSHFQWLHNADFTITDSKLSLLTLELVRYTFDVKSGAIIKKEKDPALTDDAIYANGDIIEDLGGGRYKMKVSCLLHGTIPPTETIEFQAKPASYSKGHLIESLIVRNGKALEKSLPLVNHCK